MAAEHSGGFSPDRRGPRWSPGYRTYSDYVGSEAVTQVPGTGSLFAVGAYGGEGADPAGYVESYGG